ncbi:protein-methionine-sulfoxide reductase heme-binding subunit MsrQ [Solimonas sp. SE-A11]|uniref:protein-methionine-sulfoxide reductase heme-binding subunit MsrQ n=1 Tax=Solimonas sp. SE-A11 TaxID=3054954 RepID=UPI00259D2658|nr:protein-methionine-sulfoxide reductase heme-binding subunit MsrQ [Solimonas sp. SE-A11]MDM4770525.1 protein-methionine-sulfoxide reductase heme-binding subunit MsrQ [Solimonas sp. SE-A11]
MPAIRRPLLWWRLAAWTLGGGPLLWLAWCVATARLGPNPVEFLEHQTGLWALRLLLATLAMTPLRRLSGRAEAIQVRRLLGLWAYAWITLHFATYLTFDLEWSAAQLGKDLVKRTYITLGFTAWLLLLPLALTSTRGWQRRLKRRWTLLHRLIYPAAILACLHFLWLVKSDVREPAIYIGILTVLFALRIRKPSAIPSPRLRGEG